MANKTRISLVFDSDIATGVTDTQTTDIVPNGKVCRVMKFGGCDTSLASQSVIALQWGSGGSFTTIRAGSGTFEFTMDQEFVGDGSKRFRIVRRNSLASVSRTMVAWIEAVVQDG